MTHLLCAVCLMSSKAKHRWGVHDDGEVLEKDRWTHFQGNLFAVKIRDGRAENLKGKLNMADRQVAIGFAMVAGLAGHLASPQKVDHSVSVRLMAAMFLLWDGGLLLNYFYDQCLFLPGSWPNINASEMLLLMHALFTAGFSAFALLVFYVMDSCRRRPSDKADSTWQGNVAAEQALMPLPSAPAASFKAS
eukprot:TRINITY_DN78534_c0_g1_i1.p1 TRINITY_DN78534_c0_g1~~TRINITY_DN78534_c0_g1_i1.p1  ORF type:complete len:212 (-),score=44.77 TRINITY_DN78534_c0_g1_i1:79-651(-)